MVDALRLTASSWGERRIGDAPSWSCMTADSSPIEYSIAASAKGVKQVRFMVEPQGQPASPRSYWDASRSLCEELRRRHGADLLRLELVEDLFRPTTDTLAPMAMWLGVVFAHDGRPSFKVYLWTPTHARNSNHSVRICQEALTRLGCGEWGSSLADVVSKGDEIGYFSIDLGAPGRVKIYVRHNSATRVSDVVRFAGNAPGQAPEEELSTFLRTVLESDTIAPKDDFFPRHRLLTCFELLPERPAFPTGVTIHVPCYLVADGRDQLIQERVVRLLQQYDIDSETYRRCLAAFAPRTLADEELVHTFISFKHGSAEPVVTLYFNPRLFLARHGVPARNGEFLRAWYGIG
jgi:DMATS type aromatic prenyltransferase